METFQRRTLPPGPAAAMTFPSGAATAQKTNQRSAFRILNVPRSGGGVPEEQGAGFRGQAVGVAEHRQRLAVEEGAGLQQAPEAIFLALG